jgi:hypothetical protein
MNRSPWTFTVGPGPLSGSEALRKLSWAATEETADITSAHITTVRMILFSYYITPYTAKMTQVRLPVEA